MWSFIVWQTHGKIFSLLETKFKLYYMYTYFYKHTKNNVKEYFLHFSSLVEFQKFKESSIWLKVLYVSLLFLKKKNLGDIMQMVPDIIVQLTIFQLTVVPKQYTISRNCLWILIYSWAYNIWYLVMLSSGKELQFPVSHAIPRVNNRDYPVFIVLDAFAQP